MTFILALGNSKAILGLIKKSAPEVSGSLFFLAFHTGKQVASPNVKR